VVVDAAERDAHRFLLRASVAPRRGDDRRRVRGAALHRPAGGGPSRVPCAVSRPGDQSDHHGMGQPRDGQDPERYARTREVGSARLLPGHHLHLLRPLRTLGRGRHRRRAVRDRDGRLDCPCLVRGRCRGRTGRAQGRPRHRDATGRHTAVRRGRDCALARWLGAVDVADGHAGDLPRRELVGFLVSRS
jgi:hypothetical protein